MLGAILGDIVGSPYEFDSNNHKSEEFPLFNERSRATDDSVMTVAVADGIMKAIDGQCPIAPCVIESMQRFGAAYPDAGYGGRFSSWLVAKDPKPYNSFGNGSAMRVSSVAWVFDTLEDVSRAAEVVSAVTHNHPEGIKGAQATAEAIYLARCGDSKHMIADHVTSAHGYDLTRTLDEIRPTYHHDESCQKTVPEAITAFLESRGFEDAIRKAVSIGGDSDTVAAITGSIAEAYYGIPEELKRAACRMVGADMLEVIQRWESELLDLRLKASSMTDVLFR